MASIATYVAKMRAVHAQVAVKMGSDIGGMPKSVRVAIGAVFVVLAVVVKTLTDKALVTDADLNAQLDALAAGAYDNEPD